MDMDRAVRRENFVGIVVLVWVLVWNLGERSANA